MSDQSPAPREPDDVVRQLKFGALFLIAGLIIMAVLKFVFKL